MLQIGTAEVDITPPAGLAMDGYLARDGVSLGTHDPLLAQALVLADDDKRAAIVTLDVLAVNAAFADRLRQFLANLLNTSTDAVMICASHTHCGPGGLQTWFGASPSIDPQLTGMIHIRVREAGQVALKRLAPAQLHYAAGEIEGIGGERNHKDRAVDSRVTALRFDGTDGAPIAVLFHYACHPTVLGADTRLYSADFPGAARRHIQAAYPDSICLYLNGAAGNISTRFTRRDQSFDEVERLGGMLGSRVVALLEQAVRPGSPTIAWDSRSIELPFRAFGDTAIHSLSSTGNQRIDQTRAEGVHIETTLRQRFSGRTMQPAILHALNIGPCRMAFVPGEPFNDLTVPDTLIVGYANDYLGYFPTQSAIDEQTYEALSSPYDARAYSIIEAVLTSL